MIFIRNVIKKIHPAWWAVLSITLIGAYPRLYYAGSADFPLNDGGMFLTMIHDLEKSHYAIPMSASYNSAQIPFAYPPLAFFLVSVLSRILHLPLPDILRLLPPFLSILAIPVFYLLSRSFLHNEPASVFATFAFAVLPSAFDWMVMGGGITRGLGFFLALWLLVMIQKFLESGRARFLLGVAVSTGLIILSHIGIAWFAAYSAILLLSWNAKDLRRIGRLILAAVGGTILAAPWWVMVISRYGPTPFLSAGQNALFSLWAVAAALGLMFTNEPILDLLAAMGLIGMAVRIRDRKFFLPAWLIAIVFFQGRFWQILAIVPFAMLSGVGVDSIIRMLERSMLPAPKVTTTDSKGAGMGNLPRSPASKILLGYLVLVCFLSSILAAPKEYLSRNHRDAMQWVAENTPPESAFVVITGVEASGVDAVSEWFPAIAQRESIGTPQGYEWSGGDAFTRHNRLHSTLQECATITCLDSAILNFGFSLDYVYFSLPGRSSGSTKLLEEFLSSPDFISVYQSSEVMIFVRR